MYHREIVAKNIQDLSTRLGRELRYYPAEYVQECVEVLQAKAVLDDKGQLKELRAPLTEDEQLFIQNEQLLCTLDFDYWSTHYHRIRDSNTQQMIPFQRNFAQEVLNGVYCEQQLRGVPIMIQSLKARQLGVTTDTTARILHRALFIPNTSGVLASSDEDKTWKLSEMLSRSLRQHPWWLIPEDFKQYASGEVFLESPRQVMTLGIQHGRQTSGISRGDTINAYHLCLAPETLVMTSQHIPTPISELAQGELVLTSEGRWMPVKTVWESSRPAQDAIQLKLWTVYEPITLSIDHPVLTRDGYKPAKDITKDDYVIYPVRKFSWDMEAVDFGGSARARNSPLAATKHLLTREFGKVCGLYLAEGSVRTTKRGEQEWITGVAFSMHQNEHDEFNRILKEGLNLREGFEPTYVASQQSLSANLAVNSSHLGKWLVDNFGSGAGEKFIPDWVWNSSRPFAEGIVEGYLIGDGHITPDSVTLRAQTISQRLAFGLRDLVASLGFGWSSVYTRAGGNWYGRQCRQMYILGMDGDTGRQLRSRFGWPIPFKVGKRKPKRTNGHWRWMPGGHIGIKVHEFSTKWVEKFYDLEVDAPEHSFTTIAGCVKNSELPDFTDAEALIEAGLMKTMHPTELTIGVKESTANGRGNYWHKLWLSNCAEYPKGLSLEIPIFLPWYLGTDIYPTEVWLRAIPIPVDWQPSEHIIRHAEKAREYVLENKLLWKALGLDWRMPLSQMWFYHVEYERAKAKGEESLAKFYSEMPANDTQAFQSLTGSVFSVEQIQVYEDRLAPVAGSYKFLGAHVPAPLLPESSEIISEAPSIPITYLTPQGKFLSWTLVPVATSPTDMSGLNRLLLWEAPVPGAEYVVSLDGAEGKGQDRTAMSIWKKGTPLNPPTQVGELASDNIATLEVWPIWLSLLNYFSLPGQPPAMAAPETNRGGDAALMQIMQQGWASVYRRVELASLRSVVSNYKLGWETTPKTRDQLIQWILFVVKGHWAQINSKYLLEELRDFVTVQLQRKLRLEAGAGSQDDRIFAFIIALVCLHGVDIFNAETPNWRRVVDEKKELLTFPRGGLGQQLPTLLPEELPGSIQISYYS